MEGFAPVQRGTAGDMTAGLPLGPWTPELAQHLMAQNEVLWDEDGIHGAEREKDPRDFAQSYRLAHKAQIELWSAIEPLILHYEL